MRVGEFGGVLDVHNVRRRGRKEGGRMDSVRVTY